MLPSPIETGADKLAEKVWSLPHRIFVSLCCQSSRPYRPLRKSMRGSLSSLSKAPLLAGTPQDAEFLTVPFPKQSASCLAVLLLERCQHVCCPS